MSLTDARRYVRLLLVLSLSGCAFVMTFNFVVDPLQFYRQARFYAPHYSTNQRYQNPALARTHDFAIAVLGNSHAGNFEKPLVEQALGAPALNLAMNGSTIDEQTQLAEVVLRQDRARRILWVIDFGAFSAADMEAFNMLPQHLYGSGLRAAGPYLLSFDTLIQSVKALTTPPDQDLGSLGSWWRQHDFGLQHVEAAWDALSARWTPALRAHWSQAASGPEDLPLIFRSTVVRLAREHPDVRFDLIFPPFSLYEYAMDFRIDPQRFFLRMQLKQLANDAAAELPNVRVWDFEGSADITDDLAHYRDLAHFDLHTVQYILDALSNESTAGVESLTVAYRLRVFLEQQCAPDAADRQRWCPAEIESGLQHLQAWLNLKGNSN